MTGDSTNAGNDRNDRNDPVTKFCLAMEEHRRTDAGRVRTAREMLDFFFPRTASSAEDKVFLHIPPSVRGPIISGWGVRGAKSAIRDSDDKVRLVVFDALAAGDIDETTFEGGLAVQTLIDWVPLVEWWTFWRTGKLTGVAIQKALAVARELGLFDDRWFLQNVDGRGGKLKGTDTLCDTLSKDQIVAWIRKVHESGDGSPAGLVSALGWETILTKTSQEALLFALDAFALKVGLVAREKWATEQPRGEDSASNPVIPPLDPSPKIGADSSLSPPAAGPAKSTSTSESPASNSSWPVPDGQAIPTQSGTMLSASADEAPISFQEAPPSVKPKTQPPPVPSSRKGAR